MEIVHGFLCSQIIISIVLLVCSFENPVEITYYLVALTKNIIFIILIKKRPNNTFILYCHRKPYVNKMIWDGFCNFILI